jgi:hypothetical protein
MCYRSNARTSSSTSFGIAENEVIARIERRIAAITHFPVGALMHFGLAPGMSLLVLHY